MYSVVINSCFSRIALAPTARPRLLQPVECASLFETGFLQAQTTLRFDSWGSSSTGIGRAGPTGVCELRPRTRVPGRYVQGLFLPVGVFQPGIPGPNSLI